MFPEFIKSTFSIIIVLILLTPAVVGYVLHIRLEAITDFAISIYGIYSLVYLILQIIFGEINSIKYRTLINKHAIIQYNKEYKLYLTVLIVPQEST